MTLTQHQEFELHLYGIFYVKYEKQMIDLCIYLAIQKQIVRFNIPVKKDKN